MHHTHLFSIQTDDSYGWMDYAIPGTFDIWLKRNEHRREELALHLEWLAKALRDRNPPFGSNLPWRKDIADKETKETTP